MQNDICCGNCLLLSPIQPTLSWDFSDRFALSYASLSRWILTHLTAVSEGSVWALSFDGGCFSQQPLVPPGAVVSSLE